MTQILIPAGYHTAFSGEALDVHEEGKSLLSMSRGIAVVLIGVYLGALAFQMFTHEHLYGSLDAREGREQRTRRAFGRQLLNPARSTGSYQGAFKLDGTDAEKQESSEEDVDVRPVVVPELNLWFAIVILLLLLGCTFPLLSCSHADENYSPRDELALFRRSSAERGYSQPLHLRRVGRSHYNPDLRQLFGATRFHHFLGSGSGSSPLPIEIELTEFQLDEALNLALGKATQIALFIVPLLVLIAWAMGRPLSLLFNPFQSIVLFLAILVVNFTLSPGKTNWMSGFLLYVIPFPLIIPSRQEEQIRSLVRDRDRVLVLSRSVLPHRGGAIVSRNRRDRGRRRSLPILSSWVLRFLLPLSPFPLQLGMDLGAHARLE